MFSSITCRSPLAKQVVSHHFFGMGKMLGKGCVSHFARNCLQSYPCQSTDTTRLINQVRKFPLTMASRKIEMAGPIGGVTVALPNDKNTLGQNCWKRVGEAIVQGIENREGSKIFDSIGLDVVALQDRTIKNLSVELGLPIDETSFQKAQEALAALKEIMERFEKEPEKRVELFEEATTTSNQLLTHLEALGTVGFPSYVIAVGLHLSVLQMNLYNRGRALESFLGKPYGATWALPEGPRAYIENALTRALNDLNSDSCNLEAEKRIGSAIQFVQDYLNPSQSIKDRWVAYTLNHYV